MNTIGKTQKCVRGKEQQYVSEEAWAFEYIFETKCSFLPKTTFSLLTIHCLCWWRNMDDH